MDGGFDALAGERLKAARRAQGWSQRDAEDHMRWPPGTLAYLERGKVRLTLEHASELGSLYEYGLDDLVESVRVE